MKLGDVFGKLSNIELRSIVKWYGVVVLLAVVLVVAGFFSWAVAAILWSALSALPWWGIVAIVVTVSGFLAVHFTQEPEDFGFSSAVYKDLYEPVKTKKVETMEERHHRMIRECVEALSPETGCIITVGLEDYVFDNREDALAFLDNQKDLHDAELKVE